MWNIQENAQKNFTGDLTVIRSPSGEGGKRNCSKGHFTKLELFVAWTGCCGPVEAVGKYQVLKMTMEWIFHICDPFQTELP